MEINNRILCQGRHHSGAYTQGLFWAQRTGLRGCFIYRGRAQGSQGSGGAPRAWLCVRYAFSAHSLCFLIFGLLVRTHSSEMTTSGNKGDMSVVLNAAGNFVAMVVPLLVRPHKLRNAGASAADSR